MTHKTSPPRVALLILNWNTKHYLRQFLPSILSTTYAEKEIYVIDNNSSDGSITMLRNEFPTVNIIEMHDNKGYATGYNICLQQVQADYYILVNSDIEVTPSFIEPVIELMESEDSIGICQPKLLSLDNKNMFEYAGACGGWIDRLGYPFTRGRVLLTIEEDSMQYEDVTQLFWATGACMFIKDTVYKKIGGFYDYYYMHQEDIDLCWRAQNAGFKIYVCPQSVVYHIGGGSLSWQNHLKTFLTYRNNYILLSRNMPLKHLLPMLITRLVLDTGGSIFFLIQGKTGISRAMIRAVFSFFYWMLFIDKGKSNRKGLQHCKGVYKNTILLPYFFKRKRSFTSIVKSQKQTNA